MLWKTKDEVGIVLFTATPKFSQVVTNTGERALLAEIHIDFDRFGKLASQIWSD